MTTQQYQHRTFFSSADAITDNHSLLEWAEGSRRILHAAALEMGITASELEAKLRTVGAHAIVGGLTAKRRAHQVTRPLQQASEALIVGSQYVITAINRFQAVYMPELESVGYRAARPDFKFKA